MFSFVFLMLCVAAEVLSYPDGQLTLDVCLLFLMAGLEVLRVYWGKSDYHCFNLTIYLTLTSCQLLYIRDQRKPTGERGVPGSESDRHGGHCAIGTLLYHLAVVCAAG